MDINLEINKEDVVGFDKGCRELDERMRQFRAELQHALDVKYIAQVANYRHGRSRMNRPRLLAVKAVFEKYGVSDPFDYK